MPIRNNSLMTRATRWCSSAATLPGCKCSIEINPPPNRPDPAIYSQAPRLAAGLDATWNNPDIKWFVPPAYVAGRWQFPTTGFGWQSLLDHAEISIHNRSAVAAAINTVVRVSRAPFGIGTKRTPVVTQLVSIAAGQTITFNTPLGAATSEVIRGGEALYVDISHPYDADTANNHGESVVSLQGSGNTYSIPIGNFTEQPLVYVFSLAPNNVAAQISDTQLTIAPQDQKFVQISFTIPPTRPFETSVTLLAHDLQGKLLGGVTHQLYF
jgi:hypothetical protein